MVKARKKVWGLTCIVSSVIAAGPAAAQGPMMMESRYMGPQIGTRLDVSAEASITRVPDQVQISAGVMTQAPTAQAALSANAERMARVIAALKKAGIDDKSIRTASINLSPQYHYVEQQPPVITGYQASNQLSVIFRNVAKAGAILDALVANGANQINGPSFGLSDNEAALDEARVAAIRKARARAELYAGATGLKVKRIISMSEGGNGPVYPLPMVAMSARADKAETMIQPGEQAVSVTVSVAFELE
ncbi:SIMPL domain-containing protein [Aquisediminimonas sediminicola]|uniref:SIMPL domain-containing protein n=1 Tax=Alteraquisediminimonas sediminicola TaxID=2676787 RepID=UPI001C8E7D95|nr:SIMPL domain-containing protein [Aquisediminimonas sediminicola]